VADHASAPTLPDADPMLGSTVGHYQIVARLGEGGMGVVYHAIDLRLRRSVALKLLRAHTPQSLRARERLLVEARAAAALDHTNICTVYEVGETAEQSAFIAMGFYPGETLAQLMQRGPCPLPMALDYATQIARGLSAAHARGIIHRDVKPANIVITAGGVVKLLDFGIARMPDVDISHVGMTPGTLA
jgi:serine/threonine-protein kinase